MLKAGRCYMTLAENLRSNFVPPCSLSVEGAALLDTNWLKLYEAAILEINPDKLPTYIGAAEQAIAQRELVVGITELERRKLTDARSMLKTLSRIASSQGKQAAYEAAQPTQQRLD